MSNSSNSIGHDWISLLVEISVSPIRCPERGSDSFRSRVRSRLEGLDLLVVLAVLVVTVSAIFATSSRADEHEAAISGDLSRVSDELLERRIEFLRARFEAGERHADYWQTGFTAAWATGAVLGTVQASLSSEPDNRVSAIVTASKAVIGTTRLVLSPHPARLGAQPLEIEGADRRTTLEARLIAGERHLRKIEHKAQTRRNWIAHTANVGLNVAGGAVIVGIGNPSDAIQSVGVGILFGELMLWSMPKRGEADLRDYEAFVSTGFRRPVEPTPTVSLVPMGRGARLGIRF